MGKAKGNMPVGLPVGAKPIQQEVDSEANESVGVIDNPQVGFAEEVREPEPLPYTIETISVQVPVVRGLRGYATNRVDARLTERQAHELRAITAGLRHRGATLLDGRPVDRPSHTIEWLLEQHIRDTDDIRRGDGRSS